MADEAGNVAVLESPGADVNTDSSHGESRELTSKQPTDGGAGKTEQTDRVDGRKQPDAMKKYIADLRRAAETETDPSIKAEKLARAKELFDGMGKLKDGYEKTFQTVREAREVRALLTSIAEQAGVQDWREGISRMQATISDVAAVDAQLSAGDPAVVQRMWDEAPEGMPKLMPAILDKFAQEKPQDYEKFIAPRSIKFLDSSGFPQAFDRMAQLYEAGKTADAQAIKDQLIQWVVGNRTTAHQQREQQVDPEVQRLREQLAERDKGETTKAVDTAYSAVVDHAGPVIDKVLRPIVGKLGLTAEQYSVLRGHVWDDIQNTRNADATYKTVAPAKQRLGYDKWTEYALGWTQDNAATSAHKVAKLYYGHQLKNGAVAAKVDATKPVVAGVQTGKEPSPAEIDYSGRGQAAARKAGFKDLADMILSGQAPLKAGGIRKWR